MATTSLLTVAQFLELPQVKTDDYRQFELWQGEVVEMGETTYFHNWVRDEIRRILQNFLDRTKLGASTPETGIQLDAATLYRPDVVLWDAAHEALIDAAGTPVRVIPQLVVEVKSPSNSVPELFGKAHYYLRHGVHTVWVVIDEPYAIHVFEASGAHRVVHPGGKLEAPEVLPGFSADPVEFLRSR